MPNNLLEFIQRFYYSDFKNIVIVNISERTEETASTYIVEELVNIKVSQIESIGYNPAYKKNFIRIN